MDKISKLLSAAAPRALTAIMVDMPNAPQQHHAASHRSWMLHGAGGALLLGLLSAAGSVSAQTTCSGQVGANTGSPTSVTCGDLANTTNGPGIAVGLAATAAGNGENIAVGISANATGGSTTPFVGGNTSVGARSQASGIQSRNVALGSGSNANLGGLLGPNATGDGSANVAVGEGAQSNGNRSSNLAMGQGAVAAGDDGSRIAIGTLAGAGATNSVAMGFNARADGNFSVAIGAGSTATEANTFSVGSAATRRRIVNVADGIVAANSKDAVNGGQLFTVSQSANAALGVAAAAQQTADRAEDKADTAQQTADRAEGKADTAQQTADRAEDKADTAQQTANRAEGKADTAQQTADTARTEAATAQGTADTARTEAAAAQTTANTAVGRVDTLGASAANALGGGSSYNATTGAVSAPSYSIGGQSYASVGSALDAVDDRLVQVDTRIDVLSASTDRRFRHATGGIAAAMAMGGTMIVPDSTVSVNFNLATFRGEQGFSGAVVVRAAPRFYVSGGFAGSTVKGSTGGRVGVAFGF